VGYPTDLSIEVLPGSNFTWRQAILKIFNPFPEQSANVIYPSSRFSRFAKWTSHATGHAATFIGAASIIVIWCVAGPIFHYSDTWQFPLRGKTWETYFGAGPSGVISTLHDASTDYKSDAGVGFNFLLGLQKPKGFLTEIKFGLGDSPVSKMAVGWSW
jgi:hypothetical protein